MIIINNFKLELTHRNIVYLFSNILILCFLKVKKIKFCKDIFYNKIK